MSAQFHWNPETYLEEIRAEVPRYDELQRAAIDAIPFAPDRVLELGMGTGETTRVLLEAYPDAWVIGLDSSPDMVYRLREESRALVMGDVAKAEKQVAPIEPDFDFPDTAEELAEWCGGEVTWRADD